MPEISGILFFISRSQAYNKKLVANNSLVYNELEHHNSIGAAVPKFAPKSKSKPGAAGSIWKGGARERTDDVFFAMA